jgi:plastocyanin
MTVSPNTLGPNRRRPRLLIAIGVGVLALTLITLALLPATRRLLANPTGAAPQVGVSRVVARGNAFQNHIFAPAVVQVPVGTTITWSFEDRGANGDEAPVPHDVVGADFASPVLTTGTWSHTFTTPGTFRYVCTLHPGMDGVVQVVP